MHPQFGAVLLFRSGCTIVDIYEDRALAPPTQDNARPSATA
ncbi:hypothetical protein BH23ACT11_BH23ACT11_24240 [soil metagenome]